MTTAALPKTIIFAGTFEQWQQWQSLLHALRHPETVEGWEDDAVALGAELAEAQRLIDGAGNTQDAVGDGDYLGIGQVAEPEQADPTKSNVEFGSAAWFAGIDGSDNTTRGELEAAGFSEDGRF